MYYRASDPTLSTQDWIRLNFDAIPTALLTAGAGDSPAMEPWGDRIPSAPDWMQEPERAPHDDHGLPRWASPLREDYAEGAEGDDDHAADLDAWREYERACDEYEPTPEGGPAWGTMWAPSDNRYAGDTADVMARSGFCVYDHPDVGIVAGIDGGGYSFLGGHWIPLRALAVLGMRHLSAEDRRAALLALRAEAEREGYALRLDRLCEDAGIDLTDAAPTAEVAP